MRTFSVGEVRDVIEWCKWWKVSLLSGYGKSYYDLMTTTEYTDDVATNNEMINSLPIPQEMLVRGIQVLPFWSGDKWKKELLEWLTNTTLTFIVGQKIMLNVPPLLLQSSGHKEAVERLSKLEGEKGIISPIPDEFSSFEPIGLEYPLHIPIGGYFSIRLRSKRTEKLDGCVPTDRAGFYLALWGHLARGVQ